MIDSSDSLESSSLLSSLLYSIISPLVLGGDMDFDSILSVEGNTAAITSADGFGSVCFGDDNNIFLGECGGGVGGGVDTFFGEGDVVDGGTIENTL